ncbi:hypothetical protein V498_00587 [Pseudogymnoascus sp. VKM F-4517 (FW-2822)]|nr:hypothetical protein V498_00587 [Pseudogymnoascus sp. VKM F-4517 (FW-2822)]
MDRRKDGAENKGKAARLAYWEVVIFLCCSNEEPARSVITGMPGRSTAVRRRHMPEADGFEGESMTMSVHEPPLSLTGAFLTFVLPAFMIWARPWAALARGRWRLDMETLTEDMDMDTLLEYEKNIHGMACGRTYCTVETGAD